MIGAMAISTSDTPGTVPGGKTTKPPRQDSLADTPTTDRAGRTPENSDRGVIDPDNDRLYAPGTTSDAPLADSESPIPRDSEGRIVPTPGDVRTEPVATARESHVAGRVGPATVLEDSNAVDAGTGGLDQIDPGQVLADTSEGTGPVPEAQPEDPIGEALADLEPDDRTRSDRT